jgi:hypothetical protein
MKLNDYKKSFDLNFDQFIALHNVQGNQIHKNLRYEKIVDTTRVDLGDNLFFLFKDGKLKMIYTSDETQAKKIWDEFKGITNTHTPEKSVRSRAGKTSNQLIFASQGIAASIAHGDVDYLEIFPPCALQDYLDKIYQEPQKFIR